MRRFTRADSEGPASLVGQDHSYVNNWVLHSRAANSNNNNQNKVTRFTLDTNENLQFLAENVMILIVSVTHYPLVQTNVRSSPCG